MPARTPEDKAVALVRKLAEFAVCYDRLLEGELASLGIGNWSELLSDWYVALRFFLNKVYYQGRSDRVSYKFLLAAWKALDLICDVPDGAGLRQHAEAGWLDSSRWHETDNPVLQALDRTYVIDDLGRTSRTGKPRDMEMVMDTLRFVAANPSRPDEVRNIAEYSVDRIRRGELGALCMELQQIRQIGPKVTALFVRDLIHVLDLKSFLAADDYALLQPVDTWIIQIAGKLGIQASVGELPAEIARLCTAAGVDPIRFDQGAWYIGANSFDVIMSNLDRLEARP